jgi:tRNA(Ile)-lysidine synthase
MDQNMLSRFKTAITRLTSGNGEAHIGLAISGGPDSLALLLLAHEAMPGQIEAATVDHQLRPEAANEAAYVAQICAERAITHAIFTPQAPITGNIQSQARKVRYALLKQWAGDRGLSYIATAHHADDQLETFLMRLSRGSGVDGLSGIRERNGHIIRPLLGFTKTELEAICAEAGITPVRDPSNSDTDFDRVRMRQWIATSGFPLDAVTAAKSAAALASASEAINWSIERLAALHITKLADGSIMLDPADLPDEYRRRLLVRSLRMLDPDANPRGGALDQLIETLHQGGKASIGKCVVSGGNNIWHVAMAPQRRH